MAVAIVMPKAGNSVEECVLSKWRIKVGDTIRKGDIIADAETDKTSIEVEATEGGSVLALFAAEGDLVPVLTAICAVGIAGEVAHLPVVRKSGDGGGELFGKGSVARQAEKARPRAADAESLAA